VYYSAVFAPDAVLRAGVVGLIGLLLASIGGTGNGVYLAARSLAVAVCIDRVAASNSGNCRRADPGARRPVSESPLQLSIPDSGLADYVAGTAIGAVAFPIIIGICGAIVGAIVWHLRSRGRALDGGAATTTRGALLKTAAIENGVAAWLCVSLALTAPGIAAAMTRLSDGSVDSMYDDVIIIDNNTTTTVTSTASPTTLGRSAMAAANDQGSGGGSALVITTDAGNPVGTAAILVALLVPALVLVAHLWASRHRRGRYEYIQSVDVKLEKAAKARRNRQAALSAYGASQFDADVGGPMLTMPGDLAHDDLAKRKLVAAIPPVGAGNNEGSPTGSTNAVGVRIRGAFGFWTIRSSKSGHPQGDSGAEAPFLAVVKASPDDRPSARNGKTAATSTTAPARRCYRVAATGMGLRQDERIYLTPADAAAAPFFDDYVESRTWFGPVEVVLQLLLGVACGIGDKLDYGAATCAAPAWIVLGLLVLYAGLIVIFRPHRHLSLTVATLVSTAICAILVIAALVAMTGGSDGVDASAEGTAIAVVLFVWVLVEGIAVVAVRVLHVSDVAPRGLGPRADLESGSDDTDTDEQPVPEPAPEVTTPPDADVTDNGADEEMQQYRREPGEDEGASRSSSEDDSYLYQEAHRDHLRDFYDSASLDSDDPDLPRQRAALLQHRRRVRRRQRQRESVPGTYDRWGTFGATDPRPAVEEEQEDLAERLRHLMLRDDEWRYL
jgi:hypothetical protein